MKCYVCNHEGDEQYFGTIVASGHEWASLIGRLFNRHVGSIKIKVCPNCGALHSPMNGNIQAEDRKV